MHDRQGNLDAADGGHLFAQDLLDVRHRTPAEGQVGEDALSELADVAGPKEELVTGGLDPGGRLSQRLTEQPRHPHRDSLLISIAAEKLLGGRVPAAHFPNFSLAPPHP